MGYSYDAFISYRRGDASALANWIRNRLQRYRLPVELLGDLTPEKRAMHERGPRIYLDKAYEKASDDFFDNKLLPSLAASERLIVLSTPSTFLPIKDKEGRETPNWLVREIDNFLGAATAGEAGRLIDVVLGPGAPEDRFPGRLNERALWDWIDFRAFSWWRSLGLSEALDVGFTKLVAALYDVPDTALPVLRQEERRRRRRLITAASAVSVVVLAVFWVLGTGWWSESRAREAVDHERRITVARRLIDIGAVPNAVDTLARLVDDAGAGANPETMLLLRAWSARLTTAPEEVARMPEGAVFRWRGLNFLKGAGGVRFSYEGPPALQSAVTSSGQWLVTFDADRALRVRATASPQAPVIDTGQINVAPGGLAEILDGRMILFETTNLALDSDEDEPDAQMAIGRFTAVLDPTTGIWATVSDYSEDRATEIGCDRLRLYGTDIRQSPADGGPMAVDAPSIAGELTVTAGNPPIWTLTEADVLSLPEELPSPSASACASRVIAEMPALDDPPQPVALHFPGLRGEEAAWKSIDPGPLQAPAINLCPFEPNTESSPLDDCYDVRTAQSTRPEDANTLESVLRSPEIVDHLKIGDEDYVRVLSVLGNQSAATALCAFTGRVLGDCLVVVQTARTTMSYLLDNRFLVVSSLELHADSFQFIDLEKRQFIHVDAPPAEQLAANAISPDATRLAAVTSAGEVWLYAIDREQAAASIAGRFDFGSVTAPPTGSEPTVQYENGREPPSVAAAPAEAFSAAAFLDNDRLGLAGARGGVLVASVADGAVLWSRPPLALPDSPRSIAVGEQKHTMAVLGYSTAQLLSVDSGALLSGVVDLELLASRRPGAEDDYAGVTLSSTSNGEIALLFRGLRFEPVDPWSDGAPGWTDFEQRTALGRNGEALRFSDIPAVSVAGPTPE